MNRPRLADVQLADESVPLGYARAIERAVELRELGPSWSWPVITDVMRIYHGVDRSESWWRHQLRGRVAQRSRGNAFQDDNTLGGRKAAA